MPGISGNTIQDLQMRVGRFKQTYIKDWNEWIQTSALDRPYQLGPILRKWQACRPNKMRRTQGENQHDPPYIENLVAQATRYLPTMLEFDIRYSTSFSDRTCDALISLWKIFEQLSYQGHVRKGLAGVVGISKAVMLLTNGRVGPAFDSQVRGHLNLGTINTSSDWIVALQFVNHDIHSFEVSNNITLQLSVPNYAHLNSGRIYDMLLGPAG